MTDKPIIMSAESVRAILAGRKSQTRRAVKPQPAGGIRTSPFVPGGLEDGHGYEVRRPYAPGDLLWVRETHTYATVGYEDNGAPSDHEGYRVWPVVYVDYRADDARIACDVDDDICEQVAQWIEDREVDGTGDNWRSPIHMPRWASRLTLRVTGVRAQRVTDISHADAIAEGIAWQPGQRSSPVLDYAALWDALNAKRGYPWASNPWVWAISFEQLEAPE